MPTNFFESSKELANSFLQSVVFVDDKAFANDHEKTHHDFDASLVTRTFALKEKICAVYRPLTEADIDVIASLARKADIVVLDWQINLVGEAVVAGAEEQDADQDDPRGPHTLKIIRSISSAGSDNSKGGLKLIVVYTGEVALQAIRDEIQQEFVAMGLQPSLGDFDVSVGALKVVIVAKSDNETDEAGVKKSRFTHLPHFNARVKSYEELPDFILDEFTSMTSGLLSNFVLRAVTLIRKNTARLLNLYSKDLDLAFLTHALSLAHPDDAKEQMVSVLAESIQALLQYSDATECLSKSQIADWIDSVEPEKFATSLKVLGNDVKLDAKFIKDWVGSGFILSLETALAKQLNSEEKVTALKKKEAWAGALSPLSNSADFDPHDLAFAVLTHHKSIFKSNTRLPRLTLGSIVRGKRTGYWVCIQQRCDSVRISTTTRFLFLPLKDVTDEPNQKFNFVTSAGRRLQLSKKSIELRTVKFEAQKGVDFISAIEENGQYYFVPYYSEGHPEFHGEKDEKFEWIMDLKDLHAQRIAADFAHQIARVGLDEYEWLRRHS